MVQEWRERDLYVTPIGEQRSVMLAYGTRMLVNTASQARIDFSSKQRTVEVSAGEALFEVAKDASRPFVVGVAGSEVVAVGTVFSVRFEDGPRQDDALTVNPCGGPGKRSSYGRGDSLRPQEPVTLKPGDRLTLQYDGCPASPVVDTKVDCPNIERALAWQRHEASCDATLLSDAIAEVNRYSRTEIAMSSDVQDTNYLISGAYRTGDSAAFANAVATLYGLKVRETDGRIELEMIR
ncbi:FecR family protein [Roseateles cellulosilyticus]|uniref:FecR domain-containing protein n=1 Tax=Pelomonas cellulosilytica TaxID=2906762 RepID=A0ABS8XPG7_9BURK|nr:FecR domain-containing protein [Pelomonas sp. P8]MCE4554642.1 FecR domain-containing protein [Pelomonas sp. P8]